MLFAGISLVLGFVLGYLAQRSRICFVGGLRDFLIVRDRELLKGAIAFFITAWVAFSIAGAFHLVNWRAPGYVGERPDSLQVSAPAVDAVPGGDAGASPVQAVFGIKLSALLLTLGAGGVLGLVSVIANGCPTRQHVLAAQGLRDARWYLIGFYAGVAVYYVVTRPLLGLLL